MILKKKFNRKLVILIVLTLIFLIMPASFASEDATNQSPNLSIDNGFTDFVLESTENTGELSQNYDAVYVNSSYELDDGTGTKEKPMRTIQEGLDIVNSGGTIYLSGKFIGEFNSNLTLDGNDSAITFVGIGNAVIDGNYSTSFAAINEGKYTFRDLSFINNYKTGSDIKLGGVFSNANGNLKFINCLFENNTVYGVNRGNGGAIDNSGILEVVNCTFKNNVANISNSSGFRKNAADGGAISNLGKAYIYDCTFEENKALRNGGAIRTQDEAYVYIENSNFIGNLAAYHESGGSYGGAIYSWNSGLDIYNTVFKNNKAKDISRYGAQGGAISSDRSTSPLNIISCQFINNTAEGIGDAKGQSIYLGNSAKINYCTIDTSIYSAAKDVDLNYNWWITNTSNIKDLIEVLPSSAKIKTYAELRVFLEKDVIENGDTIPISVKLCWNGTENQNNINLIPVQTINIEGNCGYLSDTNGKLINGAFNTTLKLNSINNPLITISLNNIAKVINIFEQDDNRTKLSAICDEIYEGDDAIILISSNKDLNGLCLINIGEYKYYAEFVNGNANLTVPNLKPGQHTASIIYYEDNSIKTQTTINVTKSESKIIVGSSFTVLATDYSAGERGRTITIKLTDAKGNMLSDKKVQVALDGKIYELQTDEFGRAQLQVNLKSANVYTCAISYKGDENSPSSSLTLTKITVNKKKTAIKAYSQTFKAKTKTKKIAVTLKTVKNKYDGKTYLKKGKKITLKVNGRTYSAYTNSKGIAKFTLKLVKKGKYTAKVQFAGDQTYKSSAKYIKIVIK